MFEGAIPSSTSRLTNLETLILSDNDLSGELSSQHFSGLLQLRTLYLEGNLFHGKYGTQS